MRQMNISLPELAFVAITRALGGVGVGLLLAGKLDGNTRRALGLGLIGLAAITTAPIALGVRRRRARRIALSASE